MSTRKIVCGGKSIVVGGATKYQIERFKKWNCVNSKRAVEDLLGENVTLENFQKQEEFIMFLVQRFYLNRTSIEFLKMLHSTLADEFYHRTVQYMEQHPDVAAKMHYEQDFSVTDYSSNYRPEVIRLKQLRFDGWDHTTIQGFCKIEPLVRINQLLMYPIHKFDDIKITEPLRLPDPPVIKNGKQRISFKNNAEFCKEVVKHDTHTEVEKWENYYSDLCDALGRFLKNFDAGDFESLDYDNIVVKIDN